MRTIHCTNADWELQHGSFFMLLKIRYLIFFDTWVSSPNDCGHYLMIKVN
ncbi:hypothetical protein NTGZN8_190045 [Candidatus Nitrotoga fabula]|uniref:Uncharacterized protein n=1 Tax=Candidatus Nitrotoga fabula TaxID=2182327 RepID=A0A916F9J1_9PROT|nr:hypothetical protein NTGZN8_190045 [Candidatus Nitrotoga fabula]